MSGGRHSANVTQLDTIARNNFTIFHRPEIHHDLDEAADDSLGKGPGRATAGVVRASALALPETQSASAAHRRRQSRRPSRLQAAVPGEPGPSSCRGRVREQRQVPRESGHHDPRGDLAPSLERVICGTGSLAVGCHDALPELQRPPRSRYGNAEN